MWKGASMGENVKTRCQKGESIIKYEGVRRIRTRCHGRWMDRTKARKKRRGVLCPR